MPLSLGAQEKSDIIFQAEVLEIVEQAENELPDGAKALQQNINLIGLNNGFEGKKVFFEGIGAYDVINKNIYQVGDKVLVVESSNDTGDRYYYITDYVRSGVLRWLFFIFAALIVLVGKWKGLRSIFSLIFTFLVIVEFIIPKILAGANPIEITILGSFLILVFVVYLTEGWNKKSHIAVSSLFLSLLTTIVISYFFVELSKLSGLSSEETAFLIGIGEANINFKGLLFSGIIIGALGVLDDVVMAQIATVEELRKANPLSDRKEIFKGAYSVGISHISSMTNTLFLAYAGASLPLLVLFSSGQSAFGSINDAINTEMIAEEIVRTLSGSIGLILSVPLSTWLAVVFLKE